MHQNFFRSIMCLVAMAWAGSASAAITPLEGEQINKQKSLKLALINNGELLKLQGVTNAKISAKHSSQRSSSDWLVVPAATMLLLGYASAKARIRPKTDAIRTGQTR